MRTSYRHEDGPAEVVSPNLNNKRNVAVIAAPQKRRIDMEGSSGPLLQRTGKRGKTATAASIASERVEIVIYRFGRRRREG